MWMCSYGGRVCGFVDGQVVDLWSSDSLLLGLAFELSAGDGVDWTGL